MRVSDVTIQKLLLKAGKISDQDLPGLSNQAETEKKPLQDIVIKNNLVTEKELTRLYAEYIDVPFADINVKELDRDILKLIPERIARKYKAALIGIDDDGRYILGMEDPDDIQAVDFLQKQLDKELYVTIATTQDILGALDVYRGNIGSEITKIVTEQDEEEVIDDEVDEEELAEDSPIAQTVNLILEYAIKSGASDIHIEPREDHVVVRYRVDGVLREAQKLPKKLQAALVSRIKILSNLKIDERRAPQDGRFKISLNGRQFAFRVSTLPITDGEKVVMRILNESAHALSLEDLGYWGGALTAINQAITAPHGMILVTGPTGSGKSTSLFSVLSMLNNPSVNISTVEDPVEYRIVGANQTQVNPKAGMTFVAGLRALLRQDPNIIMVGEIRDSETAGLAVQAALTGHLVFSTLHTNNAATCLPRLLDMSIEPFLIASTVRAVVGQRLVRRLCVDCRETYSPDEPTLKQISSIFHADDDGVMAQIHNLEIAALEGGIGKTNTSATNRIDITSLSTTEKEIKQLWRPREGGCDSCGHSGYRGRIGIYEVLVNSLAIQKLIVSNSTSDAIQSQAMKDGMMTMQLDGFIKALRGQTTIEEILRVTSEK